MPYTPEQHRLFEAAAHNPEVAERKGIPQATAAKLAHEGVKKDGDTPLQTERRKIMVRFRTSNLVK